MICVPKTKAYEPINELVWCPGRYTLLTRCPKRYYYHYIGNWGGWDRSASSELSQRLYLLKYLSHPGREIIRITHEVISGILLRTLSGIRNSPDDEIAVAKEIFKSYVERSARLSLIEVTRKKTKLLIDELGRPLTEAEMNTLTDHLATLLRGFYAFKDMNDLIGAPSALFPSFLRPGQFEIGIELGVPSRIAIHPVWIGKRSLIVGRWFAGNPSSFHIDQALTSDIYIRSRLRLPNDHTVEHRYYYLERGHWVSHTFTEEERVEHRKTISREFELIRSYSDDEKINTAPADRFPAKVGHQCRKCQFQTVCEEFENSTSGARRTNGQ